MDPAIARAQEEQGHGKDKVRNVTPAAAHQVGQCGSGQALKQ